MRSSPRADRGSALVLAVVISVIFMASIILPLVDLSTIGLSRQKEHSAIEAATLLAAQDLSKIVIKDPFFGYLSISDHPAVGKATLADDGEPLPVLGINTLWSSCREELLLADSIENAEIRRLAKRDIAEARRASLQLAVALQDSLNQRPKYQARDLDGKIVDPYVDSLRLLSQLSPVSDNQEVYSNFKLKLGWLDETCDSGIAIQEPSTNLPREQRVGHDYRAFVDVPIGDESFYFAAVAPQSRLLEAKRFRVPDGKRTCSIVRADLDVKTAVWQRLTPDKWITTHLACCAEPSSEPDLSAPGAMRLSFPDGFVPGVFCLRDLLAQRQLLTNKTDLCTATGGDFAVDSNAIVEVANATDEARPLADIIAHGVFDWLRTLHNRARLDSVINVLNTPFKNQVSTNTLDERNHVLLYEVDRSGQVQVSEQPNSPFPEETVSERQWRAFSYNAMSTDQDIWSVVVRDEVSNLGIDQGGKHGGQSIPGNPINWCELTTYGGSRELAAMKNQGMAGRGVNVIGQHLAGAAASDAIELSSAKFADQNGLELRTQPRKSFYAGGLAVELKFYCPTAWKS